MEKAKISELTPDNKNANIHSQYGMGLLENSVRFNGFGRSGLLSADNKIIAGNGLTEIAAAIGTEDVLIVDSDGKKPVYVRRTDIASDTPEFYNMALADNVVAKKNIVFDVEAVEALAEEVPEAKVWTAIILEEKKNRETDEGRADLVTVKLEFTSAQYAVWKKALKMGKQKFTLDENKSPMEQANIIESILTEWVKKEKNA